MLVGGEALPQSLAQAMLPRGNGVWNLYGPTETTIWSSICRVDARSNNAAIVPIGCPIANTTLYVLDAHRQPVPIGVAGELYIGGAGLARGYLDRPELTAERFVDDPFSTVPGDRLYRTGDLVRYLPDGNLEFLGRIDHQVKIRGFRIELGEVEAALAAHPAVREAVVITRPDARGEQQLIAYLVAADAACVPSVSDLRSVLKATLPDYMLPAAFVFLETLPLTPNGKIDRKALPEPDAPPNRDTCKAPRDALERQLLLVWQKLLSARPLGIDDNFFELGGHSLLAVRLVAEVEKHFGQRLPLSRLFESPTIAGLAAVLRRDGDLPEPSCLVKIRSGGSRPPLIFLPGAGGVVSYLYPLVQTLAADRPFFAFQAQGLEGSAPPHASIEAMAEHYVALLREAQPNGPYFLGGHSFGGSVAFAMAQRLLTQGERLALLAICDAYAPGAVALGDAAIPDDATLIRDIARLLGQLARRDAADDDVPAGFCGEALLTRVAHRLEADSVLPHGCGAGHLRRLLTVYRAHLQMSQRYSPADEAYRLPIVLFRASEAPDDPAALGELGEITDDWGWSRYASCPVAVHYVPGNHVSMMMPPHVDDWAQHLDRCLAQYVPD